MDNKINVDISVLLRLQNAKKHALEEFVAQSNKRAKLNELRQFVQPGSSLATLDMINSNSMTNAFRTAEGGNIMSLCSHLPYNQFNGFHLLNKGNCSGHTIGKGTFTPQDQIHPYLISNDNGFMVRLSPCGLEDEVNRNNLEQKLAIPRNLRFNDESQPSHQLRFIPSLLDQLNQEKIISSAISQKLLHRQIAHSIGQQAHLSSLQHLGMQPRSNTNESVSNVKSPWLSSTTITDNEINSLSKAKYSSSTLHQSLIHKPRPHHDNDNTKELKKLACQSSYLPKIIAQPEDEAHLTKHQCFLRKQIEVFEASVGDATTHTRGRNKPIKIAQVGIRCVHCAHLPVCQRQRGSTYFPSTLWGLYQASQNMSSTHLQCGLCNEMPESVKDCFASLLCNKSISSGGGRAYWAHSAARLGLIDTENGIAFRRDLTTNDTVSG